MLALVFMVIVGLIATVLLTLAFTAHRAGRAFRQERALRYNAESALNATVQRLRLDPTLGVAAGDCSSTFQMRQVLDSGTSPAFADGSQLTITCGPTPGSVPATTPDVDGGQLPRDVTIVVSCMEVTGLEPLHCTPAYAGTLNEVARARVRFEPDYTLDADERSVVPKILSWDTVS